MVLHPEVAVWGPYSGKLQNGSDSVKLYRPDAPDLTGVAPYFLVDEVDYTDSAPWPGEADGTGVSLQRFSLSQYGNDPINWRAGAPSAGSDSGGGTPPTIVAQPTSVTVVGFSPATFGVSATGSELLQYQWRRNGINLDGATNATLTFNAAPLTDASFSVLVFNAAGAVISSNALLTVLIPAKFMEQPQDATVFPLTNVSFSVTVGTISPVRYQWQRNGADIPGAADPVFAISNVQPTNAGDYAVVVTDAVGPVLSQTARLTVLTHPVFLQEPTNRVVVTGSSATLPASATSSTAVRYQWLCNATNLPNATNASLVISNAQAADSGLYAVIATDSYGSITSMVATLTVVAPPALIQQPGSRTVVVGQPFELTAQVSGTAPFYCRWRKNFTSITNIVEPSTTVRLPFPSAVLTNAGVYETIITNLSFGVGVPALRSASAYVIVLQPPADQAVRPGSNVTLRAIVSYPTNFTDKYWWVFNGSSTLAAGTNIAGVTNTLFTNDLALNSFSAAQEGNYTFLLSNAVVVTNTVIVTNPPVPPATNSTYTTNRVAATNLIGAPAAFTVAVQMDSNGDGIPDWWATANGFDPLASIASLDPDGDGVKNLDEYLALTNPNDGNSYLRLLSGGAFTDGIILEFNAASNRAYVVEYRDLVDVAPWQELQAIPAAPANRLIRLTNAPPGYLQRYYRLTIP